MKTVLPLFFFLVGIRGTLLLGASRYKKLPKTGFSIPQKYADNTDYGFVLINRSNNPIWIQLTNDNNKIIPLFRVASETFKGDYLQGIMAKIDLNKETQLLIQSDQHIIRYSFPTGKTIYVRWRRNKLSPQSGEVFGLRPYSKAGFLLNNNVQPGDITKL